MAIITHTFDIDMVPGRKPLVIHLNQYDENFQLVFRVYARTGVLNTSLVDSCLISGTKPDKNIYTADADWDATNKTVTVEGHKQMTAVAGRCVYELSLYAQNDELNTANFIIQVEPAAADLDSVASGSVVRQLYEIDGNITSIIDAAATISAGITRTERHVVDVKAEVEDARTGYDETEYESLGEAIRAQMEAVKTQIPAIDDTLTVQGAGAEAKTVGDELTAINQQRKKIAVSWADGKYINKTDGAEVAYNGWTATDYIDVSIYAAGYVFVARAGTAMSSGIDYNACYDENKQFIHALLLPATQTGYVRFYPGTKYIRLSCPNTTTWQVYGILYKDQNAILPIRWYYQSNSSQRSDVYPISSARMKLEVPPGYLVSCVQKDASGTTVTSSAYEGSRVFWRANNAADIELWVKRSDNSVLDTDDPNLTLITLERADEHHKQTPFRLISMNAGLWNDGVNPQPDATTAAYVREFRRFVGGADPDMICFEEAPITINVSQNVPANDITSFKLPFLLSQVWNSTEKTRIRCVAKNALLDGEKVTFASGSGRYCVHFKHQFGDVLVHVYVVHLSIETGTEGIRQTDLAEIKEWLDEHDYCVVMGDFNTYDMSELAIFENYNIANGGLFGKFATWPHTTASWTNQAIDNIITTTNISIQNVTCPDVNLSDHRPLIADLSIYM